MKLLFYNQICHYIKYIAHIAKEIEYFVANCATQLTQSMKEQQHQQNAYFLKLSKNLNKNETEKM